MSDSHPRSDSALPPSPEEPATPDPVAKPGPIAEVDPVVDPDPAVESDPAVASETQPTSIQPEAAGKAETLPMPVGTEGMDDGEGPSLPEVKEITQTRLRELGQLLVKYGQQHVPEAPSKQSGAATLPPRTGSHAIAIRLLRLVPYALGTLFVLSFVWDFNGLQASLFGQTVTFEGLLRILAVSGLIGFLTNWLAITMLFQPRERRPILGQGLIPSQRERVTFRLAQAVSEELINAEIIKQKIQESGAIGRYRELALDVIKGVVEDDAFRAELKVLVVGYANQVLADKEVRTRIATLIAEKIEQNIGDGIEGLALRAYKFFRKDDFQQRIDRIILSLPTTVDDLLDNADRLLDDLPTHLEARADDIEEWVTQTVLGFVERIDIYHIIQSNLAQFDESRLENLLKRTTNEQLNYIKYLGGVLGVFGGLVIWQPIASLVVFSTIGLTVWGLDELLYRKG
ncbi:MAG: DUF445 family protein [Bacteroidota bacterium]